VDEEKLGTIKGLKDFRRSGDLVTANFDESRRSEIIREIVEKGCLPVEVRGTEYSLEEIYLRYFREV
jgi:ABC-2 type transport system ATP-binding protein